MPTRCLVALPHLPAQSTGGTLAGPGYPPFPPLSPKPLLVLTIHCRLLMLFNFLKFDDPLCGLHSAFSWAFRRNMHYSSFVRWHSVQMNHVFSVFSDCLLIPPLEIYTVNVEWFLSVASVPVVWCTLKLYIMINTITPTFFWLMFVCMYSICIFFFFIKSIYVCGVSSTWVCAAHRCQKRISDPKNSGTLRHECWELHQGPLKVFSTTEPSLQPQSF
jgi:hypothetical protein